MNISKNSSGYDIIVIGTGLSGIKAAITAAKVGSSVLLCTKSILCSGSSFYPMMDTLHCQAPSDEADKEIFLKDIENCSFGMNSPVMNRYYADHIVSCISEFEEMGIHYEKIPEAKLACFASHPHSLYAWSNWSEIRTSVRKILSGHSNIRLKENTEAVLLITGGCGQKKHITGVILFSLSAHNFIYVPCKAVILSCGGFGSLYEHNLNSSDVSGWGHFLALQAGASLINLEFNQFIPGFLSPGYKTVFREGTLDYCIGLADRSGHDPLKDILPEPGAYRRCLEERSLHGPFTCSDSSAPFDIALMKESIRHPDHPGLRILYSPDLYADRKSYMIHYLDWLKNEHRIDLIRNPATIAPFFQSANGGIAVNQKCQTEVEGLFSCGEAAGGIHGADRLGGNATGTCLVFGRLAAESAADYVSRVSSVRNDLAEDDLYHLLSKVYGSEKETSSLLPKEVIRSVKHEMWIHANVLRSASGLSAAADTLQNLKSRYNAVSFFSDSEKITAAMEAQQFLILASAVLTAMNNRKESRGSHYREDYPETDPHYACRYEIRLEHGEPVLRKETENIIE
jgi:fumarate reductase (CoM/CoB) subunit A